MHGPENGLEELKLSDATRSILRRARIDSLNELAIRTPADLCAIPSIRSGMLDEIVAALQAHGTRLAIDEPMPGTVDLEWDLDWTATPQLETEQKPE